MKASASSSLGYNPDRRAELLQGRGDPERHRNQLKPQPSKQREGLECRRYYLSCPLSLCLTVMTFAILSLVLLAACAVLAGDTVRLDSLVRQCSFMVDGIKFDLCPILGQQQEKGGWWLRSEKETPPTVTYNSYRLSLDGALRRNASIPEERQVRRSAQGCLDV